MKWLKILLPVAALSLLAALPMTGWAADAAPPTVTSEVREQAPAPEKPADPPATPAGGQCVAGSVNDCDDYPIGQGGTCSCEWVVTTFQCQCDNGRRGHLEGNACTVCPGCSGPNCIPDDCTTYNSYVCVEGLAGS